MIANPLSASLLKVRTSGQRLLAGGPRLPDIEFEWRCWVEWMIFALIGLAAAIPILQAAEAIGMLRG